MCVHVFLLLLLFWVFLCVWFVVSGSFVGWVFLTEFQELEPMPLSVGLVVGTEVGDCDSCVTLTCEPVPQLR